MEKLIFIVIIFLSSFSAVSQNTYNLIDNNGQHVGFYQMDNTYYYVYDLNGNYQGKKLINQNQSGIYSGGVQPRSFDSKPFYKAMDHVREQQRINLEREKFEFEKQKYYEEQRRIQANANRLKANIANANAANSMATKETSRKASYQEFKDNFNKPRLGKCTTYKDFPIYETSSDDSKCLCKTWIMGEVVDELDGWYKIETIDCYGWVKKYAIKYFDN